MKKILPLALALSLAATTSFAEGHEITIQAPTEGIVAGQTIAVAGVNYTVLAVLGAVLTVAVIAGSGGSSGGTSGSSSGT